MLPDTLLDTGRSTKLAFTQGGEKLAKHITFCQHVFYLNIQWNLPERPPPVREITDWFLSQITVSETSRKRPPLVSDHDHL